MLAQFKINQNNMLSDSILDAQIAQLFNSFGSNKMNTNKTEFFNPNFDVFESPDAFYFQFALPGFKKEDLKIEIEKKYLILHGERRKPAVESEFKQHLVESFYGKFSKKVQLPESIVTDQLEAELKDGILNIKLPKTELKPNKFQVVIK
jgi:HSP20 family protein